MATQEPLGDSEDGVIHGDLATGLDEEEEGQEGDQAQVTRIVDGDTIDVSIAGRADTVRYIGIDTSERGACYYQQATDKNAELAGGRTVGLVKDTSERGPYDRLLRYVYVGDLFVNVELVRLGYAEATAYEPDTRHASRFANLKDEARRADRGLWGACGGTSDPAPEPTDEGDGGEDCHPSYPDFCILPPPPDLNCDDMKRKNFTVRHDVQDPDPHGFDRDKDGVGCES